MKNRLRCLTDYVLGFLILAFAVFSGVSHAAVGDTISGPISLKIGHSGKCLDIDGSKTANGTKVQNWDCNGTSAQSFWIDNLGGGWVNLRNTNSNKCLDVPSSSLSNGTKIQLHDCNKTGAQAFFFDVRENGYARIRNKTSNKCLDLTDWNVGSGTRIQQWDCGEGSFPSVK